MMNSTLADVGRRARLLGSGAILLREAYRALLARTNVGRGGNTPDLYFGLGVIVANGWITQDGRYFDWNPVMAYLPAKRIAIAVHTTFGPASEDVSQGLHILKKVVQVLAPEHPVPDRLT
jgi:hypothetical protein